MLAALTSPMTRNQSSTADGYRPKADSYAGLAAQDCLLLLQFVGDRQNQAVVSLVRSTMPTKRPSSFVTGSTSLRSFSTSTSASRFEVALLSA